MAGFYILYSTVGACILLIDRRGREAGVWGGQGQRERKGENASKRRQAHGLPVRERERERGAKETEGERGGARTREKAVTEADVYTQHVKWPLLLLPGALSGAGACGTHCCQREVCVSVRERIGANERDIERIGAKETD